MKWFVAFLIPNEWVTVDTRNFRPSSWGNYSQLVESWMCRYIKMYARSVFVGLLHLFIKPPPQTSNQGVA